MEFDALVAALSIDARWRGRRAALGTADRW
jgi:hypothetical protein